MEKQKEHFGQAEGVVLPDSNTVRLWAIALQQEQ